MSEKIHGLADKAWQVVVGCSPSMRGAPRCWARGTVERIVKRQETSNPFCTEFFRQALTPDLQQRSGQVFLDADHLNDPLRWTKPALIATGFHRDWGRLSATDMLIILRVAAGCPQREIQAPARPQGRRCFGMASRFARARECVGGALCVKS